MALTEKQKRYLRTLAHPMKPVVMIGNAGVSSGVLAELESSLEHHELLKVRVTAGDREERDALIVSLCEQVQAELVQRIGHVAVLYRPSREREPTLKLPKA